MGVAQLQEVFARVGPLDAGIRKMFKAQHDFVFAPRAEVGAYGEMRGEVVARAEELVVRLVVGAGPCETGAGLSEPGR